jgi:rhodanese-related sulfurtransferase
MTHARSRLLFVPVLALSMLALPTLAGCSAKVEELATDPNATKSAANEAPNNHDSEEEPTVQNHDAKGAADLLAKDPSIKILDVRTPEEYAEVHLENATLVDFRAADFEQKVGELDRDATWLVHCRSGGRSMGALDVMKKLGFKHLHHLDGGMLAWQAAELPVAK